MTWYCLHLELARTKDFPHGSASRCYLLRLPLTDEGLIDEPARLSDPARATVRRFWPNQPDLSGYVIHTPRGWAFSYRPGEADGEAVFHLESHPMRVGNYVTVTEPDAQQLPFRVANIREIERVAA
jgi:hypothetical protein